MVYNIKIIDISYMVIKMKCLYISIIKYWLIYFWVIILLFICLFFGIMMYENKLILLYFRFFGCWLSEFGVFDVVFWRV